MLFFLAIVSVIKFSSAWWCTGHMLVSHIASLDLSANHPDIYSKIINILAPLNGELTHNIANTLTETACWPDDLKTYGLNEANPLHFINKPYNPEGITTNPIPSENVIWAINSFASTLTNSGQAPLEKSVSLRFLVHFFGDIHQPLHDTALFNSQFPQSDLGGNNFVIKYDSNINELHALWDSGIGMLEEDLPRPLSPQNWAYMDQLAAWYTGNYTRSDLDIELQAKNVTQWTIESYILAVDYAYNGIQQNEYPSQQYLSAARQVVMKQIALGGYRLSDFLVSVLSSPLCSESFTS